MNDFKSKNLFDLYILISKIIFLKNKMYISLSNHVQCTYISFHQFKEIQILTDAQPNYVCTYAYK